MEANSADQATQAAPTAVEPKPLQPAPDQTPRQPPRGASERDPQTPREPEKPPRREPAISVHHLTLAAAVLALFVSGVTYLLQRNDAIELATIQHSDLVRIDDTLSRIGRWEAKGQVITLDGKEVTIPKGPIQIEFWTPSVNTKQAVDAKPWEKFDSDDKLVAFGDKLMDKQNPILKGYRRYDVVGAGRGGTKSGMWWVSSNGEDFKLDAFLKAYQDFWQPGEDAVYMEVQPIISGYK